MSENKDKTASNRNIKEGFQGIRNAAPETKINKSLNGIARIAPQKTAQGVSPKTGQNTSQQAAPSKPVQSGTQSSKDKK